MADVHLGYRQYGSEERAIDFAQAFMRAINISIEKNVDFILIAGDLFHRKNEMDPVTLTQAMKVLEKAKNAEIPVIAVEGNHDSAYFKETYSWIDYLSQHGLLVNLKPSFDDGIIVEEWDGFNGAYVDLTDKAQVRIFGMKYYGSMTEKVLEMYSKKIRKKGFTIFMAHAGIEGYVKTHGCVSSNLFHKLNVDYVALGHIHKSFIEGKIHNPGSLEVCDITELNYDRGIFYVEVVDEKPKNKIKAQLIKIPGRKFVTLSCELKDASLKSLKEKVSKIKAKNPVVYVNIKCPKDIRKFIEDENIKEVVSFLNPIVIKVRWEVEDRSINPIFEKRGDIEFSVLEQILDSYGYSKVTSEILKLKNAFSGSFDLKKVDSFIENIINITELKTQNVNSKNEEEKAKNSLIQEHKKSKDENTKDEEVWDWRRVYDSGSKTRKR